MYRLCNVQFFASPTFLRCFRLLFFAFASFFLINTKDIILHCNTVRVSEKQIIKKRDGLASVLMYVVCLRAPPFFNNDEPLVYCLHLSNLVNHDWL